MALRNDTGYTSVDMALVEKNNLFIPTHKSNFRNMLRAELITWRLNRTPLWNIPLRNWLIRKLFAHIDGNPYAIQTPFYCQYGNNTYIGKNFFANRNCFILDSAEVHIGDDCLLAPGVTITTIAHPLDGKERAFFNIKDSFEPEHRVNYEVVAPVTIGNNVWIAAGAIICKGVTIGNNVVIGAGSVVTHDIPDNVLACGIPCKVIREISEEDKIFNNRENG